MNNKSIGLNALYNIARVLLSIVFPLITFPYASRVLGVEVLGRVNYTLTFTSYAGLIAALGITTYATREGAKYKDDAELISNFSSQIFSLNLITTIIAYLGLFIFISLSDKLHPYWKLICIQSLSILFTTLSIEWINVIYEDYFYTVIRGLITNVITVILLFALVKNPDDYYVYAGLTVLTHAIISIANYFHCKQYITLKATKDINLKKHIKPVLIFFVSSLAVSLYVNSDSTMLGWVLNSYSVGLYTSSVKIYSMIKTLLAALYGVTISRLSYYLACNNERRFYELCGKTVSGLTIALLPITVGLFLFSKDIILILSGSAYIDATKSLMILSIGLVFAIYGGFITSCINIPTGREKINMIAAIISAALNIILNIYFIPAYAQNGAAITTVIAELVVLAICVFKSWDVLKKVITKYMAKNLIDSMAGIGIIVVFYYLSKPIDGVFLHLVFNIVCSVFSYLLYLVIAKNPIIYSVLPKYLKQQKET